MTRFTAYNDYCEGGAFPKGHPKLIRQMACDYSESRICPPAFPSRMGRRYHDDIIRYRNEFTHKRYSEEFQSGIADMCTQRLGDLKAFLVSNFSKAGTLFTAHKIETLVATAVILSEVKSIPAKVAAVTLCINSFSGKAVSHRVTNFVLLNWKDFSEDEENLQSSHVRELLDNWDRLNDSSFVEKMRNVASYCMAFSVLESMGLPETAAEIVYAEFKVQKKSKQVTSFIHAILDAIEFTCTRLVVCVSEGSVAPLLHTTSTYTDWFEATLKLEKWTNMLSCDPLTLEFSYQQYEKELQDVIKLGHSFIKHAKSNNDKKSLTSIVNRLELFLTDYQTKHIVGKSRLMPFGVLVYGNSSVGKSTFSDILFSFSAKVLDQKDDPEYKYTRNFRDPFWSGFKSHMWFILLDDVGSVHPKAANGSDPSVDEIIAIMNTVTLLCNMADLADKGRVAARPLVVVATTNHPWMNVHHYSYHPTALMRRFPYRLTVKVNKKYQDVNAPTMLDPTLCEVDYSVAYPDFWDITIDKILAAPLPENPLAMPTAEPILKRELTDVGMDQFLPWYREKLLGHMASQNDIRIKMSQMNDVSICDHSIPIGNCGICTPIPIAPRHCQHNIPLHLCKCCLEISIMENEDNSELQYGPRSNLTKHVIILTIKEQFIAFLCFIYFWWVLGVSREKARINAYRRIIPMMRLTNAARETKDNLLYRLRNPFQSVLTCVPQVSTHLAPTYSRMSEIAESFYKTAMENKKYIAVATTITVAIAIKQILKTSEALQFSFMKPSPQDEKRAAKWTSDSIHLSPLTLSRQTKSMKGLSEDQIIELVSRNVVSITLYKTETTVFDNNMLALGGNIYLINKHLLDRCPDVFRMDCVFMPSIKAGTRNASIRFSKSSIKRIVDDIAIVEINNFPPFARIDHLLAKRGFDVRAHGKYIKRLPNGETNIRDARNISKGTLKLLDSVGYWSECASVAGDCGSPLLAFTQYGPVIMGIHTAGKIAEGKAFCSKLYKEDIEDFILIDSGIVTLQCDTKTVELYPVINRKDPVLFLEESNCAVYGTLSTGTSKLKSNVRDTIVAPFFKEHGWSTTHERPKLGTWKPWYHGMKDMSEPQLLITSADAEWLANKTLDHYMARVPQEERDLIQLYDIDTAVSGSPGVNYVNSLAMNTSLGFPWRKPKNEKIVFDEVNGIFNLDEELTLLVDQTIETYKNGERCNFIFCASEKDEARAAEKNALGKIRLFMGAPTPLVIVMRMFFGSLIRVIQRNPERFGCAVGINAHSKEWHNLATRMLKFGDGNLFDGDYQAYDKKMEAVLIYSAIVAAGDAIIPNLDQDDFTIVELKTIYRAIATDVAFAYVDFNGTLVSFLRNHVSGEPLTVIINCFVGGIYIRYAYRDVVTDDPELNQFIERVEEVLYGDDNVISVRSDIIDTFNFASMQKSMAKLNVVYTRADKLPGSYISKELKDIEFLKRKFVYNEDLGRYVGPLAISSIKKSFLIGLCSKSITQEERDLATMNSGLREFFFHGREVYDENRRLILECCSQMNIAYNSKNFPEYDFYLAQYRDQDIVHFEFFGLEQDDDAEEELQCGTIYSQNGSDDEDYTFSYFDGDFTIEKSSKGNFRVSHIAFISIPKIESFCRSRICMSSEHERKFIFRARRLHIKANWIKSYINRLISDIGNKLTEVVDEDIIWNYYYLRSIPEENNEDRLVFETTPSPAPNITRRFTSYNSSNSRSSITVEPISRLVGGTRNYLLDASSGTSEHCVRQDYSEEVLQSSEEVILSFADENKGALGQIGEGRDTTRDTSVFTDASISKYLERPVLISTTTWAENSNINTTVNPFFAFFNDSRIKNKVTNYSLVRCKLKIKVMINASPFYYGLAKIVWKPLPSYAPDTYTEVAGQEGWKVPYSQIPGFYIHVETNEGGEMSLPFFYYKNWLRITSASDTNDIGQLQIRSFTPLLNANSVVASDVTIQVYAWAEDVELSGPTINEALQAGDEYETQGPISGPASAIAAAAGNLSKIPILKPYALATQMISSSVANVARFFGFTNVANIQSEIPQHPGAFLGMASTNLMTPYESLTLDDKNELSIDPRIAGIAPKDELMISEFCGRESWIYQSSWSSSQSVDAILFLTRVLPELVRNEGTGLYRQSTPIAHINRLFSYWRGEIRFRFQFICSKYHRGRVRITYDPDGNLYTNSVTSTTSVTRIVDISEETNVEIIIPYMQALSFLKTGAGTGSFIENMNGGSAALSRDSNFDNGQLSVRVFTKQTSPVSDAPILMNIFVSAPDIEFAVPTEAPQDYSTEVLQSSEELSVVDNKVEDNDANIHLVHFGEKVVSLRQLLRRKNLYYVGQLSPGTNVNSSAFTTNKYTLPRLPVPYGYATNGGFSSPGIVVPATQFNANYVATTPLSHILQCFVGVTGSMVYTINVDSPHQVATVYSARSTESYSSTNTGFKPVVADTYITSSHGKASKAFYFGYPRGPTGRVLTNQYTQAGLAFKLPMYNNRRFLATSAANIQASTKVDGTELDTFTTVIVTKPNAYNNVEQSTQVQFYYMAGADFNLLYFRNIPTYYVYNLPWPTI